VSLRDYRQTRQYTLAAGGANPRRPQNARRGWKELGTVGRWANRPWTGRQGLLTLPRNPTRRGRSTRSRTVAG